MVGILLITMEVLIIEVLLSVIIICFKDVHHIYMLRYLLLFTFSNTFIHSCNKLIYIFGIEVGHVLSFVIFY